MLLVLIVSAVTFAAVTGCTSRPSQSANKPFESELSDEAVMDMRIALLDIKYPLSLREFHQKLGGEKKLTWRGFSGRPGSGTYRIFDYFVINDAKSVDASFEIECETQKPSREGGGRIVVNARVCVLTAGGMFYAGDPSSEK